MCLLISVVLLPQSAIPKPRSVEGKSALHIVQNAPPADCPNLTDGCDPGKDCHMLIGITGAPAKELLKTLKKRVTPDKEWKNMRVIIYFSEDGLFACDETDTTKPICRISLNPQAKARADT
jgi:hypothetical protein